MAQNFFIKISAFKQFAQGKGATRHVFSVRRLRPSWQVRSLRNRHPLPGCDGEHSVKELEKEGSYFLVFNIEEQVHQIREDADTHILITQRERRMDMSDIKHSKGYSELGLGQMTSLCRGTLMVKPCMSHRSAQFGPSSSKLMNCH
ncbi:hypothetical protein HPB48_022426 [Haemaphysalis longicornis]|uniref:Uncharacterized protein n=1 Tax=Haemaphysalis longicornis TaxID=44386 RepID=A0A9J6GB74_HAELO|nr:hypothetical protein HPB48_022426 [Haemaphysalis longicornis]